MCHILPIGIPIMEQLISYFLHIKISHIIFFKWAKPALLLFVFVFSQDKYSTNTVNEKVELACLGLEPGAAGW